MQSDDMSALLNRAYETLLDRQSRFKYDGLRRSPTSGISIKGSEGLTGPTRQRAVSVTVRSRFGTGGAWLGSASCPAHDARRA